MKTKPEIVENSFEWDVPAKGDESHIPNKYRSRPDVDEMGMVKGTDIAGVVVAGIVCLIGVAGLIASIIFGIVNQF